MSDGGNPATAAMSSIVTRVFGLDDYGRPVGSGARDAGADAEAWEMTARRAEQPVILILTANPTDTEALRIPEELQDIKQRLRSSPHGREFEVEFEPAAVFRDLVAYLLDATPTIVHFSGHGMTEGIALNDDRGEARLISTPALSSLFSHAAINQRLRLVVLNSCFSEAQAEAIVAHVECVVGMRRSIPDATARAFSTGFYTALGFGQDVASAFDLAKTQVGIESLPGDDIPRLLLHPGVDARTVRPLERAQREGRARPPGPPLRRPNAGVVKVGDRQWQWDGVLPMTADHAYDAVERALTQMHAGRVVPVSRTRLKVGTGGILNGRFAPTEEVTVELADDLAGTKVTISSRSTQFQVSDFGHNEANVRLVVALLGVAER